jgi:hypothetical protein
MDCSEARIMPTRIVLQCSSKLPKRLVLSPTSLNESIGILEGNEDEDVLFSSTVFER